MAHGDERTVVVRLREAVAVEAERPVLPGRLRALADERRRPGLDEERDADAWRGERRIRRTGKVEDRRAVADPGEEVELIGGNPCGAFLQRAAVVDHCREIGET